MKKTILILLILCLVTVTATAAPLPVPDDYTDEIIQFINEDDPSAGRFVYSYRYPHVDEEAEGGAEINAFFEDLISLSEFESSFNPGTTTITYTITCNNDDYFSVLVRTVRASEEQSTEKWDGHVFSRKNGSPDQTWTLPRLLGILEQNENDTWLQDRQTEKADALLVDMVWERIEDNEEDIEYYPDFTNDDLSHVFFPEENYFLDETGNPVFYLQPGVAAPETVGLLTFSISLEDILDEL